MKIVITGGIGSGKSTVTDLLSKLLPSYKVLSVDKLVTLMYDDPVIGDKLIERMGTKDKKAISDIVFRNQVMRESVEKLFASQIRIAINHEILTHDNLIVEFPLLFEKGKDLVEEFDMVISVISDKNIRIDRVIERNGFSVEKILSIMDAQAPDELKITYAAQNPNSSKVIINNSTLSDLTEEVEQVCYDIKLMAAHQMKQKIGIVSGTFDPITLGHQSIIKRALAIVDIVVVGIAVNPKKDCMFDLHTREDLIKASLREYLSDEQFSRVVIKHANPNELMVTFAKNVNASFIFRGIRGVIDLDYEQQINLIQRKLADNIDTLFLITEREFIEVSSSMIKSTLQFDEFERIARPYVSTAVFNKLCEFCHKPATIPGESHEA